MTDRELLEMAAKAAGIEKLWYTKVWDAPGDYLQPTDLGDLMRFQETTDDGEGYDIGKPALRRLAGLGAVQCRGFGKFSVTAFGYFVLEHMLKQHPLRKGAAGVSTQAARDALAERQRQISAEGWTHKHDDEWENGELVSAAVCYAQGQNAPKGGKPAEWPWCSTWWKPKDRRTNLVRCVALLKLNASTAQP
jgi:hypothetical protein